MVKSCISINKVCSSKSRIMVDSSPEESGWTLYFEDFLNNNSNIKTEHFDQEKNSLVLSTSGDEFSSPSLCLVSDAASSASVVGISSKTCSKIMSFKKRRSCIVNKRSYISSDDSLEDTASSPVSSPKVSNLHQKDAMNKKQKECAEIIQENAQNSSSTELKKRGLCLVPVSTIVNYLG